MSQKLIILDLDETLVHATKNKPDRQEDLIFEQYFISKRPYLSEFLSHLAKVFKIGVWSSADDRYVQSIVASIFPAEIPLEVVWGRSRCSFRMDNESATFIYEKRLDKLKKKGFKLELILVVDDTHEKSRTNYGNAIHIRPFIGDMSDKELLVLLEYLYTLKDCENVRAVEKRNWRTGDTS